MIKPEHNAAFVCRMEDVLDLYHEPYDPSRPVVCFDESTKALHKHVRDPLPGEPGVGRSVRLHVRTERDAEPLHDE